MTKRPAEHPRLDSADTDGVNEHKRLRLDSATSPSQTASPRPCPLKLDSAEQQKTRAWLHKKMERDAIIFPVVYYRPTAKETKSRRQLADKWKSAVLELHGRNYGKVVYAIGNLSHWDKMQHYKRCTRMRSFPVRTSGRIADQMVVADSTFEAGDCVRVRSSEDSDESDGTEDDPTLAQWKAQIQEIRAFDALHVFVRVSWLYRPTHDIPGGPRPYHGRYELVPSTELSIVDARTIDGRLNIKHWDEWKDEEVHEEQQYFWRQSYDHLDRSSSECRSMCRCSEPQNPDWPIVQCAKCNEWQHSKCLEAEALRQYLDANPVSGSTVSDGITQTDEEIMASQALDPAGEVGVTASTHEVAVDGTSRLKMRLKDTRHSMHKTEERDISCLLCSKPIDS